MTKDMRLKARAFLRQYRGSQKELADMLGVSPQTVSNWLHMRKSSARLDRDIPACLDALLERYKPLAQSSHATALWSRQSQS